MRNISDIYTSNTITFARSLLALCLLLTLVFTPIYDLFPKDHINALKENIFGLNHLNFFLWFDNLAIPYIGSIIILFATICGIFPRFLCILQSWVAYSLFYTMLIVEGGDQINVIITFLLIPICILDNRRNGWNTKKNNFQKNKYLLFNASIALFFIKLQIAVLYLNAGISKIFAPEWSNGTAVYYWFYERLFGAPVWLQNSIGFLFKNIYSVSIINWSVIILELLIFIGFFVNQTHKYILFLAGVLFHLTIAIVHGLPTFGISMTGCLILYLLRLDLNIQENLKRLRVDFVKISQKWKIELSK